MLTQSQFNQLAVYFKNKIISSFDPAQMVREEDGFYEQMILSHIGLFVGVVNQNDQELCREGFLEENHTNLKDSADVVVNSLFSELKSRNIVVDVVRKSTFHLSIVTDCIYMADPIMWDENKDGVYFMWGQRYKGMYLPYQIRRLNMSKIDVMDRLCSHEIGVVANLWRLPEGLCFKLITQSYDL